jgi:hypothetical protein
MSDMTGHLDWPGAGPFTVQLRVNGLHVPYYIHPNGREGGFQLIKINPPGTPDEHVKDFREAIGAQQWLEGELRGGRNP